MCQTYPIDSAAYNAQGLHGEEKMCRERRSREAGVELARLMERQLGYVEGHIDNIALRLFIRAHWTKVSSLAHAIHNEY